MSKRKGISLIVLVLAAMLLFVCAVFFTACGGNEQNTEQTTPDDDSGSGNTGEPVQTVGLKNLVFGYDVGAKALESYFKEEGDAVDAFGEIYVISNSLATVRYNTVNHVFDISRTIVSKSTLGNAAYLYEWTSLIQVKLWDVLENAVFAGTYEQSAMNLNTLNVVAWYNVSVSYDVEGFINAQTISPFSGVQYAHRITDASNYSQANEHFEREIECQKIFEGFQPCIDAVNQIFKQVANHPFSDAYEAENYTDIDFAETMFADASFKYDEEEHSIYAENIPTNVLVSYEGNAQSTPGVHEVKVVFKDPHGVVLYQMTASITIDDTFQVTIRYILGKNDFIQNKGHVVGEESFMTTYGTELLPLCTLPAGYALEGTQTIAWSGYEDQQIEVRVVSSYEGYILVGSDTNAELNGKIIPYEDITAYETTDDVQTAIPYGETEEVLFLFSDIKSVKFLNTEKIQAFFPTAVLANLQSVDMSECIYLTAIPDGFFEGCSNLTKITAPQLPNLVEIGSDFLRETNIIEFSFDMSHVQSIGLNFMRDALGGAEARTIVLDLKSIQSLNTSVVSPFLYNRTYRGTPVIHVYFYDYLINPAHFDQNAYANLYVSKQADLIAQQFSEYPNIQVFEIQ